LTREEHITHVSLGLDENDVAIMGLTLNCLVHYLHLLPLLLGEIANANQIERNIVFLQFLADNLQFFYIFNDG
jgi:hypothetical protein